MAVTMNKLMWSAGDLSRVGMPGVAGVTLKWEQQGGMNCTCNDYKMSEFARAQRMSQHAGFTGFIQPVYCPHLINYQKTATNVLSQRLSVFDSAGNYTSDHHWDFTVDNEMGCMLPVEVLIWRAVTASDPPRIQCIQYKCLVTPLDDTEGKIWNVYWSFNNPLSMQTKLHGHDEDWADGLHIGFYNDDEPLLELARLVALQFIDIALAVPCTKCLSLLDPGHFHSGGRGRWDAIYRGHYLETHNGLCPGCDDTELIPEFDK